MFFGRKNLNDDNGHLMINPSLNLTEKIKFKFFSLKNNLVSRKDVNQPYVSEPWDVNDEDIII